MSYRLSTRASNLFNAVRYPGTAALLISLAACGSDSESIPAELNNEVLQVNFAPDETYELRVRAITKETTGQWSTTYFIETDESNEAAVDVTYTAPGELSNDPLLNISEDYYYDAPYDDNVDDFADPLFDDAGQSQEALFNDSTEQAEASIEAYNGVPKFSWEQDEDALGYEIEVVRASTRQRVGMFQYAKSSVCIEGSCELVLDNTGAESVDLPPILLIGQTVIEGQAPFDVILPSPVTDFANVAAYSHIWSIEGRFDEFPDAPQFRHEFTELGSHTVNVLVTSADGRSEYAYATVNVSEPSSAQTGSMSGEQDETPAAANPDNPTSDENPGFIVPLTPVEEPTEGVDGSGDDDDEPKVLKIPVVSVSDPEPPIAALPTVPAEPNGQPPEEEESAPEPQPTPESAPEPAPEPAPGGDVGGQPAVVAGWNDDMPLGGRAIGVVTSGISTGNAKLVGHKSSRRFMATRSGAVKSFGYQNRVLSVSDIESRAVSRRKSQPIWYEIQQAVGNDPKRGGYMLGNSYSVGNGGLQEVTLQTDDGTPEHNPSGTIIAKAKPYVPFDLPIRKWAIIDFESPGTVQAGQIYHLVYENLNPPPRLSGLSAREAQNAPIDKGAIALDGVTDGIAIDPLERHGPFLRNFPATLVKRSASSSWEDTNVTSWYSIVYTDGVEVGESYAHYQAVSAYRYEVDGNKQLRQEFTWNYPDISVDRIVTRFGYDKGANGKPMSIVVRNQSFSVVATATVKFDSKLKEVAQSDNSYVKRQTRHSVGELSDTVQLKTGQTYYIEYSAGSGAAYVMTPAIESLRKSGTKDRNLWGDGLAKQSTDGGNSWVRLDEFPDSDIPMYFIPVGVPTNTPRP